MTDNLATQIQVGDTVRVKTPDRIMMFSANAMADVGSPLLVILDGKVGKVIEIQRDDLGNPACRVQIGDIHKILWFWQVEKLENV